MEALYVRPAAVKHAQLTIAGQRAGRRSRPHLSVYCTRPCIGRRVKVKVKVTATPEAGSLLGCSSQER
jgi:hypothetical protein